ncbi:MAG: exo-alpha-sialidase [Phycisphaerae bacterium]|nr:exo-alpha-sialidase [Phycisphaerae bacterium]
MTPARVSVFVAVLALACGLGVHADEPVPASAVTRPAREAFVRLAVSKDGLTFTPTEDVFLRNASAPGLVRLPNGDLLAVYCRAEKVGEKTISVLFASRSRDEGRSWSPPRRLTFTGPGETALVAERAGSLAIMPKGLLRLYFVAKNGEQDGRPDGNSAADAWIGSAVTRNGCDFTIDPVTRIPMKSGDAQVAAVSSEHGVQLYAMPLSAKQRAAADRGGSVQAFVSQDGRRFTHRGPAQVPAGQRLNAVVREKVGWRAYGSDEDGICSFVSADGVRWRPEKGTRIPKAWDPAVVRLKDGAMLMLYCVAPDPRTTAAKELVSTEGAGGAAAAGEAGSAGGEEVADVWSAFATESAEIATSLADGGDGVPTAVTIDSEQMLAAMAGGDGSLPPEPNYSDPVDYATWLESHAFVPQDNAFDAYAAFMPMPWDEPGSKPEWPEAINDMLNSDYSGPVGPWDPVEHPDWEETHVTLGWLREQFREAARHDSYSTMLNISGKHPSEVSTDERLLFNMFLPALGCHRNMVKATIADAWRMTDGRVPAEQMRDAFETCLRAANHMQQGVTLIEHLVGRAEQRLVQDHARSALAMGVFSSAQELEAMLDTLASHDRESPDASTWIGMESAAVMDAVQYLFTPASADGQPQINRQRLSHVLSASGQDDPEITEQIAALSPSDVRAATAAFREYFGTLQEQTRTGYPEVRKAQVDTAAERCAFTNAMTRIVTPSVGRAMQLRAELEATRRATRLSFAANLVKARTGRWPASLDELPDEYAEMRIDPFTGADFAYRLEADGPRIYTLSENGVDDGGVHSPNWNRSNVEETGSDDYVFWPPQ